VDCLCFVGGIAVEGHTETQHGRSVYLYFCSWCNQKYKHLSVKCRVSLTHSGMFVLILNMRCNLYNLFKISVRLCTVIVEGCLRLCERRHVCCDGEWHEGLSMRV
jgi:hypothetical protein